MDGHRDIYIISEMCLFVLVIHVSDLVFGDKNTGTYIMQSGCKYNLFDLVVLYYNIIKILQ